MWMKSRFHTKIARMPTKKNGSLFRRNKWSNCGKLKRGTVVSLLWWYVPDRYCFYKLLGRYINNNYKSTTFEIVLWRISETDTIALSLKWANVIILDFSVWSANASLKISIPSTEPFSLVSLTARLGEKWVEMNEIKIIF